LTWQAGPVTDGPVTVDILAGVSTPEPVEPARAGDPDAAPAPAEPGTATPAAEPVRPRPVLVVDDGAPDAPRSARRGRAGGGSAGARRGSCRRPRPGRAGDRAPCGGARHAAPGARGRLRRTVRPAHRAARA